MLLQGALTLGVGRLELVSGLGSLGNGYFFIFVLTETLLCSPYLLASY